MYNSYRGWCFDMTYWRKTGPIRKILRASTPKELNKFVDENAKRHWQPISKVQQINGHFEILIEMKNGVFKQIESLDIGM